VKFLLHVLIGVFSCLFTKQIFVNSASYLFLQPSIPSWSVNRVPASLAEVRAWRIHLSGGR